LVSLRPFDPNSSLREKTKFLHGKFEAIDPKNSFVQSCKNLRGPIPQTTKPWVEDNFNTVSVVLTFIASAREVAPPTLMPLESKFNTGRKKPNFYRLMTVMLDSGLVWLLYRLVPIAMYLLRMAFEFTQ